MTTTTIAKRIIDSTWQGSDLDDSVYTGDEDYQTVLREAIDKAGHYATRESYSMEYGAKATHAFVADYTDPATGETRYAHYYGDPSGTEYEDYSTLDAAVAAYEENVRNLEKSCTGNSFDENGEPAPWFETCDVADED